MSMRSSASGRVGRCVAFQPALRAQKQCVRRVAVKGMPKWEKMWDALTNRKVESISPEEIRKRLESGDWVLVDVRPKDEYEKCTMEGAISVPVFQSPDFAKATPLSLLRVAAYTLNGVKAVEPNPDFAQDIKQTGRKVITACETGGTMKPSVNFSKGKPSRSLKAAYRIVSEGLAPEVAHLEGGVYGWFLSGSPMTAEYDTSNVGRTPNTAKEASGFNIPQQESAGKK